MLRSTPLVDSSRNLWTLGRLKPGHGRRSCGREAWSGGIQDRGRETVLPKGVVGVTEAAQLVFQNVFLYPQTLQFVQSGTTNFEAAEILKFSSESGMKRSQRGARLVKKAR